MDMNKRGQMFLGIMIFIFIFIVLIVTAPVLKEIIELGREGLDCGNTTLSTGSKATCIIIDIGLFYYAASLLAAAGAAVVGAMAYKGYIQ
jgi:hypothetical protein